MQLFTLDHYRLFIGEKISVKLIKPYQGKRKLNGNLVAVEGDEIVLRVHDEEYLLPLESISRANLAPVYN